MDAVLPDTADEGVGPRRGLVQLEPGVWRWDRRHPEWHPGAFGATVASYLVRAREMTLLIDPLVAGEMDPVLQELDRLVLGGVRVLITIPYHTRSAELLWRRYRQNGAQILGHALVAKRLSDTSGLRIPDEDALIDGVVHFHRIGRPTRAEMPIEIPSRQALVFGDAIVEHAGALRLWEAPLATGSRRRWYEERFVPTMRRLTALDTERILVTHGLPVLRDGRRALESALERGPWQPPRARKDAGA